MGIKITDGKSIPGLVYDDIFLVRMDIRQEHRDINTDPPVFKVVIKYRMFAVDGNNVRHYSGDGIQTLNQKDFLTFAQDKAVTGDPTLIVAFGAIQEAIAVMIADSRETIAQTY